MTFYRINYEVYGEFYSGFDRTETEDFAGVEKKHEQKISNYGPSDYTLTSIEVISKSELEREILQRKELVKELVSDCERDPSSSDGELLYEIEGRKQSITEMEQLLK
ncbi:MAG: hypothetical protein ACRBFS_19660 [Aureispira sp.]